MQIIYDDLAEFAEIVIRCEKTADKGKCMWCPFYDRCQVDSLENRHTLCAEVVTQELPKKENNNA